MKRLFGLTHFLKLNLLRNCAFYGFGVFLCLAASAADVLGSNDTEHETYLGVSLDKELGSGFEAFVDGQIKSRGLLETEYFRKVEVGGTMELSERISLRGSFKGIDLLGTSGWHRYYVPGVGATIEWKPSRLEVDFRNIMEFWHIIGDGAVELRIKQRIRLSAPSKIGDLEIKPYVSEEYLSAINTNDHLIWNRVSAGNSFYLGDRITLDVFYIWQRKNGSLEWRNAHVAGGKIRFSF